MLLLLVAGAGGWWFTRPKGIAVKTTQVRTASSGGSGSRTLLNASGYVTARLEATVSSKITGKVTEILVEEGMKVEKGQVLARLDRLECQSRPAPGRGPARVRTDSTWRRRSRWWNSPKRNLQRLNASRLVARRQRFGNLARPRRTRVIQRGETRTPASAEITVAEREVDDWKQQLDDTIIRAPFAGIVTSKNAQPGEMISPMSAGGGFTRTGICTIVDMTSLEIEVDVNESYINRVKAGPAGRGDARCLSGLADPLQGHRHHPDGRSPEGDGEGARRLRSTRPAHPAGHGREGGVSKRREPRRPADGEVADRPEGRRCRTMAVATSSGSCATARSSAAR